MGEYDQSLVLSSVYCSWSSHVNTLSITTKWIGIECITSETLKGKMEFKNLPNPEDVREGEK